MQLYILTYFMLYPSAKISIFLAQSIVISMFFIYIKKVYSTYTGSHRLWSLNFFKNCNMEKWKRPMVPPWTIPFFHVRFLKKIERSKSMGPIICTIHFFLYK